MGITTLEQNYANFTNTSKTLGSQLAESVNMLQLDSVNSAVAEAVLQMESMVSKSPSKMASIPFIGKYLSKAKTDLAEKEIKSSKMVDVVDRLFTSLSTKKDNMMNVMETLFNIKELLVKEVAFMIEQESLAREISMEGKGIEVTKAKNLLVQVSQSIVKSRDRISVIDTTCKAAEATTMAVSQLLPSLQGELITEMAIQGGLQELKDFKTIFDNTLEIVNNLSQENNSSMIKVLEDVVDLSVTRPTDIARLEETAMSRNAVQERLKKKLMAAQVQQDKDIKTLTEIRSEQQLLRLL